MPKAKNKTSKKLSEAEQETLLDQAQSHVSSSKSWLATRRDEWSELESMLIVKAEDSLSSTSASKVFDPRLSTHVYSMSGRVMAQMPVGKAYATSKDDLGKTVLMNLLLEYYAKSANEQRRFQTKLRMMDLYSHVYGSMFALVPWRIDERRNYIGPELTILGIRDSLPQPNKALEDADWFVSRNVVSLDWLQAQAEAAPGVWLGISELAKEMENGGDESSADPDSDYKDAVSEHYYPNVVSDVAFPQVETFTEYRRDEWITWAPKRVGRFSRPHILRVVENPYPDGMLPVVVKDCFPLLNSPIGIGEFARGKTLQYAINSLINLYLDGVKFSIFPPLHVDPNNVVPSSMKWGAGEFWFMNNPNRDVQPMNISPQGLDTFQSTYGFLTNALVNQFSSSDVVQSAGSDYSLGKTPAAVKSRATMQSSRDDWDLAMMDETIQNIYERWISLTLQNQEVDVERRLFSEEIEDIKDVYPDVVEMFESGRRAKVTISRKNLDDDYDFVLEPGSTYRVNKDEEQEKVTSVLRAVVENPEFVQAVEASGKQLDVAELFKRWVQGNIKDWDKIIKEAPVQDETMPQVSGAQQQMQVPPEMAQQMQVPPQQEMPQYNDPEIAQMVQQAMGMVGGVPTNG